MERNLSEEHKNVVKERIKSAKHRIKSKPNLKETIESQENRLKRNMKTRLSSREEWKQTLSKEFNSEISLKDISRDESFDFFFKNDVSSERTEHKSDSQIESTNQRIDEQVIDIEGEDTEDSKVLVKDMFSLANNWNLIEKSENVFISRNDRIKSENNFLYFPSDKCSSEENEELVNEELKTIQKFNGLISMKNFSRIKDRLRTEGLTEKFSKENLKFAKNDKLFEVKNSINYLPEFGSERDLITRHKSSVPPIKEIFGKLFKRGDNFIQTGISGTKNMSDELKNLETLNADQLNQLLEQMKLEDNQQNDTLVKTIEDKRQKNDSNDTNGITSDKSGKELQFCTDEDIESNPRWKLLSLRWQGVPQFKNYRFVPLNEKEIPLDLFETKPKIQSPLNTKQEFEEKREKAIELLTKVGEQLIKQSSGTVDRPRTLEDMVIEEELMGISAIGFTLFPVAQQKRPLNPYRRERKKIAFNLISGSDIRIVITIMHALNVPIRKKEINDYDNEDNDFSYETKVCPFVEAVFQRQSVRTNTAEGTKPTWNESLSFKFTPPENESLASNLAKVSDCIYLNLFDEVVLDSDESITTDGRKLIHKRTERRWLGSLRIPFSTLYLNSKIEGTFSLSTPLVLLGYEYDNKGYLLGAENTHKDISKQTYLTLFLTIDPSLQLPEPIVLKCDTIESESLMTYAKKWRNRLQEEFANRNIKALAVNLEAKFVLVSRYLRPLKPPEEFLTNFNVTKDILQRLARFVSLIPKVPDSIALPGVCDIWCTCDQLLDMSIGDEEEHAILLCNYFLYLDKRAAILLGHGIPEGRTAYVIIFEYGRDPHVFNASTGEQFSVRDSYLPLNSIGCVITPENIFANISKSDHPNRLNYDINKSSEWRPFFGKQFPFTPITSIQPESLEYSAVDSEKPLKLQENLEKHLRESFMRWRKRRRTFFNRHVIQSIKKMLPRLESTGKVQVNAMIQELHDVLVLHEMTGFPLNMPFTDFESITEAVFATGVHLAEDKGVEFALAVYIHPYPSSIFSVWVYVAALTKSREV